MKSYQYQILRYYPDVIAEEFLNVGLVLFVVDERKLISKIIENPSRLSSLNYSIDIKSTNRLLKNVNNWINSKGIKLLDQLNYKDYSNIDMITNSIIPPNDSSLKFSNVRTGITLNIDETFNELYERFVSKFEKKSEVHSRDDKKAWLEYKKIFEKFSVDKKLVTPKIKIKTEYSEFEFPHGWKNGKWNFCKPISFDLSNVENIKKKAWEWAGITQELLTSDLDFNLTYLALSPKVDNVISLKDMLSSKFNQKNGKKNVTIIFENKAEEFAQQLLLEFK